MKKLLFILIALVSVNVSAQSLKQKKTKAKSSHKEQNSLLYKVSGNGLKSDSYIFGTVHAICQDDLVLSDSVHACLKKSKALVLEADESKANPNTMMLAMMMKGDTSIKMLLSEEEFARVNTFFSENLKLSLDLFLNFKPLMISSLTLLNMMPCPSTEISGVEKVLTVLSKEYSLNIKEVEGVEYQLALMDSISYSEQAKTLLMSVDSFEVQKKELFKLLDAYKKQDLEALASIIENQSGSDINYDSYLLETRNRRWIGKLEKMMKAEPCFIAVGAAHLITEVGILELLQMEGYTVQPIYPN